MKIIIFLLAVLVVISAKTFSGSLDLEKLCDEMYKIYDSDEIAAKKEVLAYKKLNGLIGTSVNVKNHYHRFNCL